MRMLTSMPKWKASDLFLSEGQPPAARINGQVQKLDFPATKKDELEALLKAVLAEDRFADFLATGDADVGYSLPDGKRFRLNLLRQRGQLSLVARALPLGDLTFDDLGLPKSLSEFISMPRGLILVTGATGSGKSTTLAALINGINHSRKAHIVTLEDPIEFVHNDAQSRITQREIGSDSKDFRTALKHVVRQSPDVILIGEMRDRETMSVALSAALTGHLVLASLHTIDAAQTLQRILSYYPAHLRAQAAIDLSLSLKGVICQRLLPSADGKGRVVAVESLTATPGVKRLIREQRIDELQDLMRGSNTPAIVTFNRALLRLFRTGKVTHEVGKAFATNPDEFALSAQGMETGTRAFHGNEGGDATGLDMQMLLRLVLERHASDLHLAVGRPPILRIAGELRPLPFDKLSAADLRLLLYSILNVRQRSIYELERELDFALALDDGRRFRVNAYFQKGNMAAALRAIPSRVPSAEALMLPQTVLQFGSRPHGLVLVVGPTGSGKTTTMACLVDRVNRSRACRIITVEDPIEYIHEAKLATIDQREVYEDTKSFSAALKYVLRQDPDVILVGEMRDQETISAALTAAETGHLVLATLHTNDAVQAIDRVIDVFPPHQQAQIRSQLASALLGVVSQRLLPSLEGGGRVPVFEIMVGTSAIRTLIRDNKMHQAFSYMETHRADGMVTMDHALLEVYKRRLVSYEDAARFMRNPKALPKPEPTPATSPDERSGDDHPQGT